VKKEKEKGENNGKQDESICYHYSSRRYLSCTCRTPKHLKTNKKNIKAHFSYEDSDFDYGHMDVTHLDIVIFFVKPNWSIDHLIGNENIKKKAFLILIFMFIWRMNVGTSTNDEDICLIDSATTYTILKSNKFSIVWFGNARHQC